MAMGGGREPSLAGPGKAKPAGAWGQGAAEAAAGGKARAAVGEGWEGRSMAMGVGVAGGTAAKGELAASLVLRRPGGLGV